MDLEHLFDGPDHFLTSFTETDAVFVEMDRDAYYRSIFLDGRRSPKSDVTTTVRRAEPLAPPCHTSHPPRRGWPLRARALDLKEQNRVRREPMALRQLGVTA